MSAFENAQLPAKVRFLKKLTSSRHHHGKKTLYQHLCNVYAYLESQSCPEELRDAGLFHSIYGTEFFTFHSGAITRDVVRGYIGEYAEELVYIFCGLRRERFESIVNNTLALTAKQHLDLCWLEYANCWDHQDHRNVEMRMANLKKMEILSQVIPTLTRASIDTSPLAPLSVFVT